MAQININNGDSGLVARTAINDNFSELYGIEVKCEWYEEISSGTSGTLTKPTGSTILLNEWGGGVDALASTSSGTGDLPDFETPVTSGGTPITATLDLAGAWTLSGIPSAYPVCIIYAYRVAVTAFDETKSLLTTENIDHLVDSVNSQVGAVVLDADDISDAATTNKFVTAADITNLSNLSGTNTGDNAGVTAVTGASPVVSSGGTTPAISLPAATNSADGHATAAHITAIESNTSASHAASHTVASHSDTTATGAQLNTLVGGADTTLHSHAGGYGHTVQDEGTNLTARTNLNFIGSGVTAADDSGNDATTITIAAGAAPVDSVNTQTGTVVLDADDISDAATTNKFVTAADITKLSGIESLADVTDTANVTSAGALMDSEVDADIKTLVLPASTTISTFGASLVDDADAAAARATLGVDASGTGMANVVEDTTPQLGGALDVNDKSFTEIYTAGELLAAGDLVYLKSDGKFWKADASVEATSNGLLAVAVGAISADATGAMHILGSVTGFTGLTVGGVCYISTTAGAFTQTKPSVTGEIVRVAGYALSATVIVFNPSAVWIEI